MISASKEASDRRGLTLIELLTVFAIISIIGSISLVGIQSLRESSRKLACQNNMHQIALALQSRVSQLNALPALSQAFQRTKEREYFAVNPLVVIAEQMDTRFAVRSSKLWSSESDEGEPLPPSQFRCASNDDNRLAFRLNMGVELDESWVQLRQKDKLFRLVREGETGMRLSEVTDGMSNTIALSERFSPEPIARRPSAIALINVAATGSDRAQRCENALARGTVHRAGEEWWSPSHFECAYTHFDSPNASVLDCEVNALLSDRKFSYRVAARSRHNGGVQACKLDGSALWVASGVDAGIWRSISTPHGNEIVSN